MKHMVKIVLKILLIILLILAVTGGVVTLCVFFPIIAIPVTVVLLISFYFWKNRSTTLAELPNRSYHTFVNEINQDKQQFKVMSYNVMADNVSFKLIYSHMSYPILNFKKYRGPRIILEISHSMPSIILMQEIDHYNDFYKPELEKLGYDTYLNKRFRLFRHGALVGFQKKDWEVEEVEAIDLNEASKEKKYRQHAAAIMAIAKSKHDPTKKVLACSIHTYFMGNSTKYLEVAYTTHRIRQFLQRTNNENIPVIFAGDFNAYKSSPIITYLFGEQPKPQLFETDEEYQEYQKIYDQYPYSIEDWKLQDSYESYPINLPTHYTHHLPMHKGVLDFIFYSQKNLEVTQLLVPMESKYLLESGGTPNKYQSSDHLRIEAEFQFK